MDARMRPLAAALRDGRSPHAGTTQAALEFIHTNNSPNPILALLSGRFEAVVYASKTGSRIQLNRLSDHGMAPCNMGCVMCDLFTRGSGGVPRPGRGGYVATRP